jgi:hypothetical protein
MTPDPLLHFIRPTRGKNPTEKSPSIPSLVASSPPVARGGRHATTRSHSPVSGEATGAAAHRSHARRRSMAASLCSPPPLPSAFRRSRAVVRASSSSSSSSSSAVSSSSSAPKARFVARRSESVPVQQLVRPLGTRSLPPSRALPKLHGLYLLAS